MTTDHRQYLSSRWTKEDLARMLARAVDEHRERLEEAQKYGREQFERADALEAATAVPPDEYARAELLDELANLWEARFTIFEMTPEEFAAIQEARKLGNAAELRQKEEGDAARAADEDARDKRASYREDMRP